MLRLLHTPHRIKTMMPLLALLCLLGPAIAPAAEPPNIVYIVADDLGWKDVGFHGGAARTPQLDRLAKNGAMLNAFYVQPTSSQTRAAALTGRYPMRYGLQTGTVTAGSSYCLPEDERTLAAALTRTLSFVRALVAMRLPANNSPPREPAPP